MCCCSAGCAVALQKDSTTVSVHLVHGHMTTLCGDQVELDAS